MAIRSGSILELRASCPIHLQAAVLKVSPPTQWPGPATVLARVERVFRGDLSAGETIAIEIATVGERAGPPGDFYYAWANLQAARYLEVYLIRTDKGVSLPTNSCSTLLDALTEAPVLAFTVPDEVLEIRGSLLQRVKRWLGM